MPTNQNPHPADALNDSEFRKQMQGLKDMTALLNDETTSPVVLSTDPGSVLNKRQHVDKQFLAYDDMSAAQRADFNKRQDIRQTDRDHIANWWPNSSSNIAMGLNES